jgi:hypothetical protein
VIPRFKSWRHFLGRCEVRWRLARRVGHRVRAGLTVVRFEWVPADLWVGVFRKWRTETVESERWRQVWVATGPVTAVRQPRGETTLYCRRRLDVWVCLIPCLPLHLAWRGPVRRRTVDWIESFTQGYANEEPDAAPELRPARTAALVN